MSRRGEIIELTRVRVLLFLRQPEAIFWTFVFPLLLAAVLGFAFRKTEVASSRVAVVDRPGVEQVVAALEDAEAIEVERVASREAVDDELRKGILDALVEPGDPPALHFDPNRPEAELTRLRIERALDGSGERADGRPLLRLEPASKIGSRYVDFLFPGLLGLNLMGTGMWTIGFAIADLRQKRVLKRLLVTPMARPSFLLSFLLARLVFLALELIALVGFGAWILGVPFRANLAGFGLVSLIGAFVFSGLGLLAVSRARTVQGASGILNLVMMPMWLCSGVFFPYERFPEAFHPVLAALPLSALNDALRSLMLDGQSLSAIAPELGILAIWGGVGFLVALRIFRWD